MRWVNIGGYAHAIVRDVDDQTVETADELTFRVGVDFTPEDVQQAREPHERPFGPDTCRACHQIVKRWTLNPTMMPPGLFVDKPTLEPRRAMTAEARRASVEGRAATSTAPAPSGQPRSREGYPENPDEGMDWPDEPAAVVSSSGAIVVKPSGRKKGATSNSQADDL